MLKLNGMDIPMAGEYGSVHELFIYEVMDLSYIQSR